MDKVKQKLQRGSTVENDGRRGRVDVIKKDSVMIIYDDEDVYPPWEWVPIVAIKHNDEYIVKGEYL